MLDSLPAPDRRGFLLGGAAVTAAAGAAGAATPGPNNALPNLYPDINSRMFRAILRHEQDHTAFIVQTITRLGGTPRPQPTFKALAAPDMKTFATMSRAFTNTGTGAYAGAAPVIFSKAVLGQTLTIATTEARHAGWTNTLLNQFMTTNVYAQEESFERALTVRDVVDLASPYLVSLNGGPPATFSSTPSAANDIAILNFALILEYLELQFYSLNVPKFFN